MPPVVQKQQPPKTTTPTKTGNILSRAIDVADLVDDFIKMTIYGKNRTGKTHLAGEFPKPALFISFEPAKSGGAKTVKRIPGIKLIRHGVDFKGTAESHQLMEQVAASYRSYATVVIDTITSFQTLVLQEILGFDEAPIQLSWGGVARSDYELRAEQTKKFLRKCLTLPLNTVILAQEKDHNPPDKEKPSMLRGEDTGSFFSADLGGATAGWLYDACDYIGRLYIDKETKFREIKATIGGKTTVKKEEYETGRAVRRLRTMYHPNYMAGFRSENPKMVPEFIQEPTYDRILKVIQGKPLD